MSNLKRKASGSGPPVKRLGVTDDSADGSDNMARREFLGFGSAGPSHVEPAVPAVSRAADVDARLAAMERAMLDLQAYIMRGEGSQSPVTSLGAEVVEEGDEDPDPFDALGNVDPPLASPSVTQAATALVSYPDSDDEKDNLINLTEAFVSDIQGHENSGRDVYEELAKALDESLRRQPSDVKIRDLAVKYPFPGNLPKLRVPSMNDEVLAAMPKGGKVLEAKVTKATSLMGKALVPVFDLLTDVHHNDVKPIARYFPALIDACRLQVANINYMHQLRKDIAKFMIKEPALAHICSWDVKIGEENLFPFDVTKHVEDYKKALKLGAPKRGFFRGRGSSFRGRPFRARGSFKGKFGPYTKPKGGKPGTPPASK